MSGNKSQLPSPQLNLDEDMSTQPSDQALPPKRIKPRRNTAPVLLDDRIAAVCDRETASRERSELRHKFGD